jgi:hypothetical protein
VILCSTSAHDVRGVGDTNRPGRIRTLIADDNLVTRLGLRSILEGSDQIAIIGETGPDPEAVRRAERLSPDVFVFFLGFVRAWFVFDTPAYV